MEAQQAVDIHFFKPSKKRTEGEAQIRLHNEEKRRRTMVIPEEPNLSHADVYNSLFECHPSAVVFSVVPGYDLPAQSQQSTINRDDPHLPAPLDDLYDSQSITLPGCEFEQLCSQVFDKIKISKEEAEFLERSTRSQSSSVVWHEHRKGRITSSYFSDVFKHICTLKSYPTSLVKKILQYEGISQHIPALKWGREKEAEARTSYIKDMEEKHTNFVVRLAGLVIDPRYPFLGASPDGFVSCECCGKGVLEIKCTYKYRDDLPTSKAALSDHTYFLEKDSSNEEIHLSRSHKYYYQVQGQMSICGVGYCDFVCWPKKACL